MTSGRVRRRERSRSLSRERRPAGTAGIVGPGLGPCRLRWMLHVDSYCGVRNPMTSPTRPPFQYGATYGYLPAQWCSHPPPPTYPSPPPPPPHWATVSSRHREMDRRRILARQTPHNCNLDYSGPIFQASRASGFTKTGHRVCVAITLEAGNEQWGYVLDRQQLIRHVALPLRVVPLMPAPEALTNVTLVRVPFDYTGLRAQRSSHCVVYQLFGPAVASLQDRFARERVFPWRKGVCTTSLLKFFLEPPSALRR